MFSQSLHKWFVITLLNQQKGHTSALKKKKILRAWYELPKYNANRTSPKQKHFPA